MKKFTRLLFISPVVFFLVSCGNGEGKKTLYFYTITKENTKDQKDSLYATSDEAAFDSTIKRYYTLLNKYQEEKSKTLNNPYLTRPTEWHVMNNEGNYVTSVSEEEIKKLEEKYKAVH